MSKASTDILNDLHRPAFQLDSQTEAELVKLAKIAENIWEVPSARVEARKALAKLCCEVSESRRKQTKRRRTH